MSTVPEATDRTEQAERVLMPAVGGPKHGTVIGVDSGSRAYLAFDWSARGNSHHLYTVKKFVTILPGRTDRQCFKVLVHPSVADDGPLTWRTVVAAWAGGWSPSDDTSELRWHEPAGPAPLGPGCVAAVTRPIQRDPFVDEIYRRRVELGWTQVELARRAGVSNRTISATERGAYGYTLYTLRLVTAAVGLEPVLRPRKVVGRG